MEKLLLPYEGRVRLESRYGMRTLNGVTGWHAGVDLVGLDNKILRAPCDGVVGLSAIYDRETDTTRTWEWGNFIRIDRADGLKIYLCHMSARTVFAGQHVRAGEQIGIEGDTGYSFGSHCHFEVRLNGEPVDPTPYLGIPNGGGIYENPSESVSATQEEAKKTGTPGDGNTPHEWSKEAFEWAVSRKLLQGDGRGNYRLNDPITREELIELLYRLSRL